MLKSLLVLVCIGAPLMAQSRTMTFDSMAEGALVDDYYNGGAGGSLGVSFHRFWARTIRNAPTPNNAAEVQPFTTDVPSIEVAAGFQAVSFAYRSSQTLMTFTMGRGSEMLASRDLPNTRGAFVPVVIWIPAEKGTLTWVHMGHVEGYDSHVMFDNLTFWNFKSGSESASLKIKEWAKRLSQPDKGYQGGIYRAASTVGSLGDFLAVLLRKRAVSA